MQSRLPLTVLVHCAATDGTRAFVDALLGELRPEDTLWLVASDENAPLPVHPLSIRGSVLDLRNDTAKRTYNLMNANLVYFPGHRAEDANSVKYWSGRAHVLVADGRAQHAAAVLAAARDGAIESYRWDDGLTLVTP